MSHGYKYEVQPGWLMTKEERESFEMDKFINTKEEKEVTMKETNSNSIHGIFNQWTDDIDKGGIEAPIYPLSMEDRKQKLLNDNADREGKPVFHDKCHFIDDIISFILPVYEYGAKKYEMGSCENKLIRRDDNINSIRRHRNYLAMGEEIDQESGFHHLAHLIWRCGSLVNFIYRGGKTSSELKSDFQNRDFNIEHQKELLKSLGMTKSYTNGEDPMEYSSLIQPELIISLMKCDHLGDYAKYSYCTLFSVFDKLFYACCKFKEYDNPDVNTVDNCIEDMLFQVACMIGIKYINKYYIKNISTIVQFSGSEHIHKFSDVSFCFNHDISLEDIPDGSLNPKENQ